MPAKEPYEEPKGPGQVKVCQRCYEHAATKMCKCGCPLCIDCWPKHVCNRPDLEEEKLPN